METIVGSLADKPRNKKIADKQAKKQAKDAARTARTEEAMLQNTQAAAERVALQVRVIFFFQ